MWPAKRWILSGLLVLLVATLLLYFAPGNPDSPSAGTKDHLGASMLSALVVTLVAGAMIRWVLPTRTRDRDDER
jgi:hypothetical protein